MRLKRFGIGAVVASLLFAFLLCGCSGSPDSSKGPDYADDEAMGVIAKGLEARWAITDTPGISKDSESIKKAVNAELEIDKALKDRQFEDSKMQEAILKYINTLEDSLEVIDSYPYESFEYYEKWKALYDDRTSQIKSFVEKYDLKVSEKYQSILKELLTAGTAAQKKAAQEDAIKGLVKGVEFEKVDEGYGLYRYCAIIENTTDYNFSDVGIVLALYDGDGVKAGETYANTSGWGKGEKVRFEAVSSTDAARVKADVEFYRVVE